MQLLLVVGILLAYGPTLVMSSSESNMQKIFLNEGTTAGMAKMYNAVRAQRAEKDGIKFEHLKPTESLKVPEPQCGRDYIEEFAKFNKELESKYPSDIRKQVEEMETTGEDTTATCFIPSRTEINCKLKKCEGSEKSALLCVCGPKKCKLGSDGLCDKKKESEDGDKKKDDEDGDKKKDDEDDEEDGSSSLFVFGTMLNLTIFYLISSFF